MVSHQVTMNQASPQAVESFSADYAPGNPQSITLLQQEKSVCGETLDHPNFSPQQCLDKLAESRRKWMICLERYRPAGNSSSRAWSCQSNAGAESEQVCRSATCSSHQPRAYMRIPTTITTVEASVVHAADFCQHCAAIVEVDLDFTADGMFVAENRAKCSSCLDGGIAGSTRRSRSRSSTQRGDSHRVIVREARDKDGDWASRSKQVGVLWTWCDLSVTLANSIPSGREARSHQGMDISADW